MGHSLWQRRGMMKWLWQLALIGLLVLSPFRLSGAASEPSFTARSDTSQEYQSLISLFFAAARTGNDEVVNEFLSAGFPINQRNAESYTALMVAAYQGNAQTVELLLRFGANACLQDKRGNTALMGALLKREIQIARALYQAECADDLRNKAGLSVQEFAELYGQSETLKALHQEKLAVSSSTQSRPLN
ncbi:ankyrin repeat domain-containing protein [Vibrio cholerae]|nr:ankyrin repeat domain-containing protein [Vibrio cholerae]EGR4194476.1 ankyrin repeat domain-containing protein [Vibrio cholerae]KAA1199166.1 ankyrin repeat domain-containing protein [Vibrio cholerae]MCD1169694.1 ankyrin repeat domain-containing protein [Vibrio cholerae]MUH69221.1 ankyrin repeat domain-containing protein [Vibrio cholerae]